PSASSGPTPLASSCSEPCVTCSADLTVAIQASPVVVTLPGPILTSFPQSTAVDALCQLLLGPPSARGFPISSGASIGLGAGSGLC
ncbi:KRFJ protein, partial [Thalassarche chlororhynchos]|nr:KRFJ protein [Thalassarche chlororhynchos]